MYAPPRTCVRANLALRMLIVLPLLIACGASRAEPVKIGSRTLNIPAPGTLVESSDSSSLPTPVATILMPGAPVSSLYVTPEDKKELDSLQPGTHRITGRVAEFVVIPGMEDYDAPDVMFKDGDGTSPDDLARGSVVPLIDRAMSHRLTTGIGASAYLGVYRAEPWGVFYSFSASRLDADGGHSDKHVYSAAMITVGHRSLYLITSSPVRDRDMDMDTSSDLVWTRQTLSNWVDAIRRSNTGDAVPGGTHRSTLYKVAPWIILALLALMAYFLFFKKKAEAY